MEPPSCTDVASVVRTTAAVVTELLSPDAAAGPSLLPLVEQGHHAGHRTTDQGAGDGRHGHDPLRGELSHWNPTRRCRPARGLPSEAGCQG